MPATRATAALIRERANDPDKDGTLDLAEVKAAATALFTSLDPDKDGTLDARDRRP
jgi:hypothetical protein